MGFNCSTASRLEPLQGGSLLFTSKFPEIPGTFNSAFEYKWDGMYLLVMNIFLPRGLQNKNRKFKVLLIKELNKQNNFFSGFNLFHPDPGRREKLKALKALIKHFDASQRSVKIKIKVYFHFNTKLSEMKRAERVNKEYWTLHCFYVLSELFSHFPGLLPI